MNFISLVTRTINPIKGRSFKIEEGKKITPTQARILKELGRSSYFQVKTSNKRAPYVAYTTEERYFIAEAYNYGCNREEIVNGFIQEFGSNHPLSSIGEKVEICKATDNQLINHTEFVCNDKELISILQDMDSKRFGSSVEDKIDSVLDLIRA